MPEFLAPWILPAHFASTWAMVGILWMVQIVQYPLFAQVGSGSFDAFHARYLRSTTWVVGPFMLLESATAVALLYARPEWMPQASVFANLAGIFLQWTATALFSVPMHRRLERSFDERAQRFLVRSNWVRTWTWSARGLLLAWWLTLAI